MSAEQDQPSTEFAVKNDGQDMTPVFVTAQAPVALLNNILQNGRMTEEKREYESLAILTTTSAEKIMEIMEYTKSAEDILDSGKDTFSSPFVGWDLPRIYEFVTSNIRAPEDDIAKGNGWTNFTFVVADEQTLKDETVLLCYDGPDYDEAGQEVVLKASRVSISNLADLLQTMETLNGVLSEQVGDFEQVLTEYPPSSLVRAPGEEANIFQLAAPQVARANKRAVLIQAVKEDSMPNMQDRIDFARTLRVGGIS